LGYVGYSEIFINILKRKQEIDPLIGEELIKILKTMNRYRIIGLIIFGVFLLSTAAFFILLFGSIYGYIQLNFKIIDYLGPVSGVIFFSFAISIIALMEIFKRIISRMLKNIDSDKLP
jgi:hypothetical protein